MLTYSIEPIGEIWDEFMVLARAHWSETESYRHQNQPLNPSKDRYVQYEKGGWYKEFTARNESGELVGHIGMYVMPSMHSQCLVASEDTLYILPEYRKGRNALNLMKYVEAEMRKLGVVEISASTKPVNNAGRLLEYMGYVLATNGYSKHLKYE